MAVLSEANTEAESDDMRQALSLLGSQRDQRLLLAFQPITRMELGRDDACLYSEALLRERPLEQAETCTEDRADLRGCAAAIGALERLGWMERLDFSVLWTVLGLLKRHPAQRLGCNVSAATLHARQAWSVLLEALAGRPEVACRLTLEITETNALTHAEQAMVQLDALRRTGVRIAIDDLGAGFTTFEFLARCRPEVVKIDRVVLLRSGEAGGQKLLDHLVRLCADYSPCVVVEGVETAQELERVRQAGAHAFQGFLQGRPSVAPPWSVEGRPVTVEPADTPTNPWRPNRARHLRLPPVVIPQARIKPWARRQRAAEAADPEAQVLACLQRIEQALQESFSAPATFNDFSLAFAQRLLQRCEDIVQHVRGVEPGDRQAIEAYQNHLALAYYDMTRRSRPPAQSLTPVPGSAWSHQHLQRLSAIGLRHGALARESRNPLPPQDGHHA